MRRALLAGATGLAAVTVVGVVFWLWASWARGPAKAPARPTGLRWAQIPAGAFEMGCVPNDEECHADEYPRHRVSLSRGFQMLATEVTVAQMTAAGYRVPGQTWSTDQHPALNITWLEAQAFCEGVGGRLPTEAEWEYAARGGHGGSKYPWGTLAPTCLMGAPNGARVRDCGEGAEPVQAYAPNGYGLYDMAGNAAEWVQDWYDPHYYESSPQSDPSGPQGGRRRAVRGGSWFGSSREVRVSARASYVPEQRFIHTGFRCVREVR